MSQSDWRELLEWFADGRKICNCGEAYCDEDGMCPNGCSANQIDAKHEIAEKVLLEIEKGR